MKRITAIFSAALILLQTPLPRVHAADDSGTCGENVTWKLEGDVLTLSGTGPTTDYKGIKRTPWAVALGEDVETIKKVVVGEGITSIGSEMFSAMLGLTEVSLPETLVRIEDEAFISDALLTTIRIPDSVEYLGSGVFCETGLTEAVFPPKMDWLPDFCYNGAPISGSLVIPDRIKKLGASCFLDTKISECVFPDTDIEIGAYCLSGCHELTKVHLPEQLTKIPYGMFQSCESLSEIEIPPTVTSFGRYAFGNTGFRSFDIPEQIREIEKECFEYNRHLESVTIHDGLTEIPEGCFDNCFRLISAYLPDSVSYIGRNAFAHCDSLTELRLPENPELTFGIYALPDDWVRTQGDYAVLGDGIFYRLAADKVDFTVPDGVKTIQSCAFEDPIRNKETGLTSVIINDGCESISEYAFNDCTLLKKLVIPGSVKTIHSSAVVECPKMETIVGEYYSAAHAFAIQNGYAFEPMHEETLPAARYPDLGTEALFFGNNPGLFSGGYHMTDWAKAMLLDYSQRPEKTAEQAADRWGGSCYGLSIVTVLAAAGLIAPSDLDPSAETLHDVQPTDQALSVINYYQMLYSLGDTESAVAPMQHISDAIRCAMRYQEGGIPFVLRFARSDGSGHAVVGYGIESGEWEFDGLTYDRCIRTWDCNYSEQTEKSRFYFDSQTLRWRIPAYGVYYTDKSHFNAMLCPPEGDAIRINRYGYFDSVPLAGDADLSGTVNTADAVYLARFVSEQSDLTPITHRGAYNADTDSDGILDLRDACAILRTVAAQ